MFVGEGPGFHEDRQGEPFVGAAGKLLTELLGQIGLTRADVYIANVVKCRPPENRDPLPDEIEACRPHLMDQIAIIRPRVICTLGRFATKLLADTELSMSAIHGRAKAREVAGVSLVVFPVFHPAAALYTPSNRQVLEQDFAKLRHLLAHGLAPRSEESESDQAAAGDDRGDLDARAAKKSHAASPGPEEQLPLW
jgi:uracil-DNA glycosylase family 4